MKKIHGLTDAASCPGTSALRKVFEIPGLGQFYEVQANLVVAGSNEQRWTAIALVDNASVNVEGSMSFTGGQKGDRDRYTTAQTEDLDQRLLEPRTFFLLAWKQQMTQVKMGWEEVVSSVFQAAEL